MTKFHIKIITTEKIVFEGDMGEAIIPIEGGLVTFLPNHNDYLGNLKIGEIVLRTHEKAKGEFFLAVAGGLVEFRKNVLIILANRAEKVEDIDLKRAMKAYNRVLHLRKQIKQDDQNFAKLIALIEKEANRIALVNKFKVRR